MDEKFRTIYLENAWPALVTKTARTRFREAGWSVDGNWLNNVNLSPSHRVILAAPAHFDGASLVNPSNFPNSRVWSHLIFPDDLVGWNYQESKYAMKPDSEFIPLLESAPILSNSYFTLNLALETYGGLICSDREVSYLPIEFYLINSISKQNRSDSQRIRVLWNHMWRSDKGVLEAFCLIDQISKIYADVEFHILRDNDWGSNPDTEIVKEKAKNVLTQLRMRENVYFHQKFPYQDIESYWRFLATQDIGFSVSPHESFGLSMLEQQAAGVSIVVPNRQAYPEIHKGALITDQVGDGISTLIENRLMRLEISQLGKDNANRFNADDWANRIISTVS